MKTSYAKDMVMSAFDTPFRKKCMLAGILIFVLFPFFSPPFFVHISNLIAIACMGAMALNLVVGNAGLLSLGHAGFMCAGAFTVGILNVNLGMPIWITMPSAIFVGMILGFISSLPSLRLKGLYLAISTMCMHYIIIYFAREYQFFAGQSYGIQLKDPNIGIVVLSDKKTWYFFLWFFVWLTGVFIANLLRSRPGRAWNAIRERDIAARVTGISIGWYKIFAFVVGTGITSMAGGFYAYYTNLASVDEYDFLLTVYYLAMIIVGGLGFVFGSIMGAFLITLIPYSLIYLFGFWEVSPYIKRYFWAFQSSIFGLLIIVFLLSEPLGLVEIWKRIRTYFQLWPFKYKSLINKYK